jgi:hypothetical protein
MGFYLLSYPQSYDSPPLFGCRHLRTIIGSVSTIMDSQQAQPVEGAQLAIDVRSAAFSVEERPNPLL